MKGRATRSDLCWCVFSRSVWYIIKHTVGVGLDRPADYEINALRSTRGSVKTEPYRKAAYNLLLITFNFSWWLVSYK